MFKMKHAVGKENMRCDKLTPQTIKPGSLSPIHAPPNLHQHTFAKARQIKMPINSPSAHQIYAPPPSQQIDLECNQNLQAFEGGAGLRQMVKQIQNELHCDEQLQEPCSKCTHYQGIMSRVRIVLQAYHKKTVELQRQLRLQGEKDIGQWDRQRYYRQ